MKTNTLFQVRFKPSVKPPRGFTKSAHYNVLSYDWHNHKYLIGNTWLHASNFIKIEIEDAPVFKKPVLRKIASLKPDEVIECNDPEVVKAVLEQAIKEGLKDAKATLIQINESESIDSYPLCIGYKYKINDCFFQHNGISYSGRSFYESECCTILPASKFVEVEAEAKPELVEIAPPAPELKPFPQGYMIPKGTRVVALTDGGYSEKTCREGDVGTVVSERSVGGGYVDFDGRAKGGWPMRCHELAPLDPRDHPEHPEFGKGKQEEPITQAQKDECLKLQERIKELEALCELRQQDIDCLCEDNEAKIEENTELSKRIDELRDICLVASNTGSKAIMYSVLRAIANGEI